MADQEVAPYTTSGRDAVTGVVFVILASLVFVIVDQLTRSLMGWSDVWLVYALQHAISFTLLVAVLAPKHGRRLFQTQRTALVLLRGVCLAVAVLATSLALQRMALANTLTIILLVPFALILAADLVLGETVSNTDWLATCVGFGGVILIIQPGITISVSGFLFALIAVGATVAYAVLTRILVRTETTMSLVVWSALVGMVIFGVPALAIQKLPNSAVSDLTMLVIAGVLLTLGNLLFTVAFRKAPVATLAPAMYMKLFFAACLGLVFFGEKPRANILIGMALLVIAGSGVALSAHLTRKRS